MVDEEALAVAYRQLSRAYNELAQIYEGNQPSGDRQARELAVMLAERGTESSRGIAGIQASRTEP
jgi:hypothetical protein